MNARPIRVVQRKHVMLPCLMRGKPEAKLLKAAWQACTSSFPFGPCGVWTASSQFEAGSAAISYRGDRQLPNMEALL